MKKLLAVIFAMLILAGNSFSSAIVLDKVYSPERYTNISGNYSAEDQAFEADSEEKVYKFALAAGQSVLIDAAPVSGEACISIAVSDSDDRLLVTTPSSLSGEGGMVMCGYTSKNGGEYYAKLTTDQSEVSYSISISFFDKSAPSNVGLPFKEELSPNSDLNYISYPFSLSAGDAFSFKSDNSYFYILFSGNAGEFSAEPARYYEDGFYGYCGVVADSCTATVFIPAEAEGNIFADTLAHQAYRIEDVYLPLSGQNIDLSDAISPFDSDTLVEFTHDFGKDAIDNRPLKFFRFHQQPQQIIQISAEKELFDACKIVSCIDSASPLSGQNRLWPLQQYDMIIEKAKDDDSPKESTEGKVETETEPSPDTELIPDTEQTEPTTLTNANILTLSTGKYMLAIRDTGSEKLNINVRAFEAFTLYNKFKATYEYGDVIENISIKNLFVDTNNKDEEGDLKIPYVSCIKLIDDKGHKTFYNVRDRIQPAADRTYNMYAVITDNETTYQVFLHSFNVINSSYDFQQSTTQQPTETSEGLSWWMILLIIVAVYCVGCCLFLLLYKKDINDVK